MSLRRLFQQWTIVQTAVSLWPTLRSSTTGSTSRWSSVMVHASGGGSSSSSFHPHGRRTVVNGFITSHQSHLQLLPVLPQQKKKEKTTATTTNDFLTHYYPQHQQQQHVPNQHHSLVLAAAIDPTLMVSSIASYTAPAAVATGTATTATTMDPLLMYLLQSVIYNGVPAVFTIGVVGFIAWQIRSLVTDKSQNSKTKKDGNNNGPNSSALSILYDDVYGDQDQDPLNKQLGMAARFFGGGGGGGDRSSSKDNLPKNTGVPKLQYITVTHLNPKYDSYRYSMTAQTQSKAIAASQYRHAAWQRAWGKAVLLPSSSVSSVSSSSMGDGSITTPSSTTTTGFTPFQIQNLMQLEQEFLQAAVKQQQEIQSARTILQRKNMDETMKQLGMESVYQIDPPVTASAAPVTTTITTSSARLPPTTITTTEFVREIPSGGDGSGGSMVRKWKGESRDDTKNSKVTIATLTALQSELVNLEMKFLDNVMKTVGPNYAATIRTIVLGSENGEGLTPLLLSSNMERPLTRLLTAAGAAGPADGGTDSMGVVTAAAVRSPSKRVYVTRFPGDTSASQVNTLREEITAILQSRPRPSIDEVVLVLQTGGGTVTGYGLAAAQLQRIKNANIHLTIAVEQVAASGGYMMACIADTIVASPFAVLGSIGVISDTPNFYDRLKKEGIEFQTVTAGKFKRTITPTKKVTAEDLKKSKEEIEEIFGLFRDFVKENRPKLDIDMVATGETWFGTAALEKKLCDEIQTVDDLLLNKINNGDDVYEVKYSPPDTRYDSVLGKLLNPGSTSTSTTSDGPIRSMIRWLVQSIASEVRSELSNGGSLNALQQPIEKRYMAVDKTSDQVRSQL